MADSKEERDEVENPDIHFDPIVKLEKVEVQSMEEDEEEIFKMYKNINDQNFKRAKLFRFDNSVEPAEWKERGTGDVKFLKHKKTGLIRILMRRDKTLKVCANHYLSPQMQLKPNCGSDRAWVWSTPCDFADDEPKPELLAIRLANAENAQKFKTSFEESKAVNERLGKVQETKQENEQKEETVNAESKSSETDSVVEKLSELSVQSDKQADISKPECDQANSSETKTSDAPESESKDTKAEDS